MPPTKKAMYLLLLAGILLCMVQIWAPAWYLTGDGPCHVANAHILHDIWQSKHTEFYSRFYKLNFQPDPNWSTHILLAALMYVVNGLVAEKLLLSILVLSFIWSFYLLVRQMNVKASLWPAVVFVFIFQNALAKGFYNFSFSLSFYCFLVYSWLVYLENRRYRDMALFFAFLLLTWFTHPVAFVFGCFTCGFLAVSYRLSGSIATNKNMLKVLATLAIGTIPVVLLLLGFSDRSGGLSSVHLMFNGLRLWHFTRLAYVFNFAEGEKLYAGIAGWMLCVLFVIALLFRIKERGGFNKYDGLIAAVIAGLFLFFCLPDWMLGGGLFSMRAALFTYILLCCCCAYMPMPPLLRNAGAIVLFTCFGALFVVRLPVLFKSAEALSEHMKVGKLIRPYTVVLPLNFNGTGKDAHGQPIVTGNNIFCHMAQYLCVAKPLIILDNYEANTGYFPLKWRAEVNPYALLSRSQGFENIPPAADIREYTTSSGVRINYVVMYNYNAVHLQDTAFAKLAKMINEDYHVSYTSPTGRTILHEHN